MTQDFIVLTSPPASGKTFWIDQYAGWVGHDLLLIITPLRALADECRVKWGEVLIVMTPEEWLHSPVYKPIVIFDEIHLNFYWGDTFRPVMWEVFYELSYSARLIIGLTATLSLEMQNSLSLFTHHFDHMWWVNCGNQRLKYKPLHYIKVPSRKWLLDDIFATSRESSEVSIIFCAYKQEVFRLSEKIKEKGFRVWTCVGGEAKKMQAIMIKDRPPHFIVCTTVLSHGVNLPEISKVYLLYQIQNIDFWIQMVARGGRKGNSYKVLGLENPYGIKWGHWTNSVSLLILGLKLMLRQFHQWFLKDF